MTAAADFTDPGNEPASVTFGLTAITSELSDTASSFTITGPSTVVPKYTVQNAGTGVTIDSVDNPLVHQIPKATTGINATYTVGGLTNGIVLLGNSGYTFVKAASIDDGVSLEITSQPTLSATLAASQPLSFVFDTPDTTGYAKIYVEVPVFAINTAKSDDYGKPEAIMWYIRGGANNKKVDSGGPASSGTTGNDGGAVLIELYDPEVFGGVNVNTPTWP